MKQDKLKELRTRIIHDPDLKHAGAVARAFARNIARDFGVSALAQIDECNAAELEQGVCHSHDFCDGNVYMDEVITEVTGLEIVPNVEDKIHKLWHVAWDYAQTIGFRRLAGPRGVPACPPEPLEVHFPPDRPNSMMVQLPGLPAADSHPLDVELDYWGRSPRLQVLCREHDSAEGEPKVVVRYDERGRVVEVIAHNTTLIRDHTGDFVIRPYSDTTDTPWEIDRDSNPACREGDLLQCPSGQVGRVMRLRDRYDGCFNAFKENAETYGLLERLAVYNDIQQAWDVNPLTVGTTDPADFSTVPELPTPAPHAQDS